MTVPYTGEAISTGEGCSITSASPDTKSAGSDGIKIANERALPFEPLVPNKETMEAMKAAPRGELVTVGKLLASRNADC